MTHLWEVTRGVLAEALGHEEEKGEGVKVEKDVSHFVELYDFVSDRCMAVRKDMILQGLSGPGARGIYQRIIRFHIFFDYLLTQQVSERKKGVSDAYFFVICSLCLNHANTYSFFYLYLTDSSHF